MAIATLNGNGIISGAIAMPRVGAWTADLTVDSRDEIEGAVTLALGTDGLEMHGTVNRGAVYQDTFRARVVGGADGLRKTAPPKHYAVPILRIPLADMLTAAGERISTTADSAVLTAQLQAWTTLGRATGVEMADLLMWGAPSSTAWRTLADGSIWVGVETWPDSGVADFRETSQTPAEGSVDLGVSEPTVLPGTTIDGRRVDVVETIIASGELRTRVWWTT